MANLENELSIFIYFCFDGKKNLEKSMTSPARTSCVLKQVVCSIDILFFRIVLVTDRTLPFRNSSNIKKQKKQNKEDDVWMQMRKLFTKDQMIQKL